MGDSAWNVAGSRRRRPGCGDVCWGVIFIGCRYNRCRQDGAITQIYQHVVCRYSV